MNLLIIRDNDEYLDETLGILRINQQYFGETLELPEGKSKAEGIAAGKIICIPRRNDYKVKVTYSEKFKKRLPLVYNDEQTLQVITPEGTWGGIRFHGANTINDLLGCIGIARTRHVNEPSSFLDKYKHKIKNWIQGSLSDELTKKLDNGEVHNLIIK